VTIGEEEGLMMEAVRISEMSVKINLTTRRYIPEDSKLLIRRRENLKSHHHDLVQLSSARLCYQISEPG
jgi:hypothetical protein